MSVFSKIFGKKRTVDTSDPQQLQPQAMPVAAPVQNEQANPLGFEVVNDIIPDGEQVAEVYLNVDTESKSRSHMTAGELMDANVGHTWLTVKPLNGRLPADLDQQVQPQTRSLINAHGETAMGFWPITVRTKSTDRKKITEEKAEEIVEENEKNIAEMQIRSAKGFTRGSGGITREEIPDYDLHSTMIGKDTAGRVEEPDDAHSPKGRKVYRITRKQFREMYQYINAHRNHKYNLYSYNCTTFAAHALRAAGQTVPMEGMTMPTSLYEAMYIEAKKHAKDAEKAKKRGRNIGQSSVQLLKLAEGEAHRKKGKDKEGPQGKNVRVKGVDKFDMPMFTDDAEILLRTIINRGGEVSEVEKSEFALLMFKNASKRTLDAVRAYTEEAKTNHIMTKDEQDALIDFYTNGFNSLDDPTPITTHPDFFYKYMFDISEALPDSEAFTILMNDSTLSEKHNYKRLTRQLMKTILDSKQTVGDGFEQFVEKIPQIAFIEPIKPEIIEGLAEAIQHLDKYQTDDLYRLQYLIKSFFQDSESVLNAAKSYFMNYFNKRIQKHLMTPQVYNDAVQFRNETGMAEVIPEKWMQKLSESVENSRKFNLHSTIYSKDGTAVNTNPNKYVKAQKVPKNAPKPDENEIVAEAYLNVDVSPTKVAAGENVSRSSLSTDVGHTWLTLKAKPTQGQAQGTLPSDIEESMQKTATGKASVNIIRAKGETAMGFYPLQNSFIDQSGKKYLKKNDEEQRDKDTNSNLNTQAMIDLRKNKGFTLGAGDVERNQTQYHGFSPIGDVTGRVEEPDDAHSPKGRKRFTLTRKQFKKLYQYVESHRAHKYNLKSYNCTTFATHALRDAGHHASGSRFGICYPAKMYRELYDEAKRDARNRRQSDVQLLKLAENESHGEFKLGKTGDGENVRVKGVKSFDMVKKYVDPAEVELHKIEIDPQNTQTHRFKFIETMINNMSTRSVAEATSLANEANRMFVLKPKEAEALIHLQQNFGNLKKPLIDYKNLPLAQISDFLTQIRVLLKSAEFTRSFADDFSVIAFKLARTPVGTEDFKQGIELLNKFGAKNDFTKQISEAIKNLPVTKELVLGMINLNAEYLYNDTVMLDNLIMNFNHDSRNQTFAFILEAFREPAFNHNDSVNSKLISLLGMMIPMLQNAAQFAESLTALNKDGLLANGPYEFLYKQLTAKAKP